ncbi:MAG: zf-HC2 domain-containing protein [Desulfobacterales bacterium]|nr:zf-HC2 domain-containing protein [Desulfobacterales bacterium]
MGTGCIDTNALYDYVEGELSARDKDRIEKHLASCDTCLDIFLTAKEFWKENHLAETVPEKIDSSVLETIYSRLKQFYQWVAEPLTGDMLPQPLRSGAGTETTECIKLSETSDNFHKELIFYKTGIDEFSVDTRISGEEITKGTLSVILEREHGRFEACSPEQGHARFEGLPFGSYRFILEQDGSEKGTISFEINETGLSEK